MVIVFDQFDVILLEKVGDVAVALTSHKMIYPEKGLETHGDQGWKLAVVCSPEAAKFSNEQMILPPKSLVCNLFCSSNSESETESESDSELSEDEGVFEGIT